MREQQPAEDAGRRRVCLIATARHRIVRLVAVLSRIVESDNVLGTMPNAREVSVLGMSGDPAGCGVSGQATSAGVYPATTCLTSVM